MSLEMSPITPAPGDPMSLDVSTQPRKSYRRKYRKNMVKFEERMRESTNLFRDEQRIFDISQRLAEQNDQLLQLLLELNQSPEVPSSLRYHLSPVGKDSVAKSEHHEDKYQALEKLRLQRYQIQTGGRTVQAYQDTKNEILSAIEFEPSRSYSSLAKNMAPISTSYDSSIDPSAPSGAGYLTIRQEEQYLQSLNSFINNKTTNSRAHVIANLGSKSAEKSTDREREMQLRNPVSVYNWLRRHQPQVFLQDHESSNDKGSKAAGSRSSKRTASNKEVKQEQEYYDEDGIALEYNSAPKGKRKRKDDGAFRPKGGKPGHGPKRRKEDPGKRSKRSSMDARVS